MSKNYTAFMCCSDYYAAVLMRYLSSRGVRIPEDLSFTGFDDIMLASMISPPLTTVKQDINAKGKLAVQYLVDMIQGKTPEKKSIRLPVKIVVRDSVKKI